MVRTRLVATNFKAANLQGVDFKGADIRGANFRDADLQGAINLSKVIGLKQALHLQDALF